MGIVTAPTIDSLAVLRRRIRQGQALLETYDGDARWQATEARLEGIIAEYRHAMHEYRTASDIEEIQARIARGVEVLNQLWDDEEDVDGVTFERALARYEVLVEINWSADMLHNWYAAQMRLLRSHREHARERGRV